MFKGSFVALVTPFKDGQVDEEQLTKLVEYHIENGTQGIVPCGTTGESPTLSHEEHDRVVELVVKTVNGRVPVIAGSGSNSTKEALRLTKHAKDCGADAALVITPYYNKPSQAGLYEHFAHIASNVDIPIVIYNVPGRTGVAIAPETTAKLFNDFENIVSIKEASGDVDNVSALRNLCDINILSGDDGNLLPMLALGTDGVISVAANILPKEMAEMIAKFNSGDLTGAKEIHYKMYNLFKVLFIETNPVPVKEAMDMMGMMSKEKRLPLVDMQDGTRAKLEAVLVEMGLVK